MFVRAVEANRTLTALDLSDNTSAAFLSVSPADIDAIDIYLKRNRTNSDSAGVSSR